MPFFKLFFLVILFFGDFAVIASHFKRQNLNLSINLDSITAKKGTKRIKSLNERNKSSLILSPRTNESKESSFSSAKRTKRDNLSSFTNRDTLFDDISFSNSFSNPNLLTDTESCDLLELLINEPISDNVTLTYSPRDLEAQINKRPWIELYPLLVEETTVIDLLLERLSSETIYSFLCFLIVKIGKQELLNFYMASLKKNAFLKKDLGRYKLSIEQIINKLEFFQQTIFNVKSKNGFFEYLMPFLSESKKDLYKKLNHIINSTILLEISQVPFDKIHYLDIKRDELPFAEELCTAISLYRTYVNSALPVLKVVSSENFNENVKFAGAVGMAYALGIIDSKTLIELMGLEYKFSPSLIVHDLEEHRLDRFRALVTLLVDNYQAVLADTKLNLPKVFKEHFGSQVASFMSKPGFDTMQNTLTLIHSAVNTKHFHNQDHKHSLPIEKKVLYDELDKLITLKTVSMAISLMNYSDQVSSTLKLSFFENILRMAMKRGEQVMCIGAIYKHAMFVTLQIDEGKKQKDDSKELIFKASIDNLPILVTVYNSGQGNEYHQYVRTTDYGSAKFLPYYQYRLDSFQELAQVDFFYRPKDTNVCTVYGLGLGKQPLHDTEFDIKAHNAEKIRFINRRAADPQIGQTCSAMGQYFAMRADIARGPEITLAGRVLEQEIKLGTIRIVTKNLAESFEAVRSTFNMTERMDLKIRTEDGNMIPKEYLLTFPSEIDTFIRKNKTMALSRLSPAHAQFIECYRLTKAVLQEAIIELYSEAQKVKIEETSRMLKSNLKWHVRDACLGLNGIDHVVLLADLFNHLSPYLDDVKSYSLRSTPLDLSSLTDPTPPNFENGRSVLDYLSAQIYLALGRKNYNKVTKLLIQAWSLYDDSSLKRINAACFNSSIKRITFPGHCSYVLLKYLMLIPTKTMIRIVTCMPWLRHINPNYQPKDMKLEKSSIIEEDWLKIDQNELLIHFDLYSVRQLANHLFNREIELLMTLDLTEHASENSTLTYISTHFHYAVTSPAMYKRSEHISKMIEELKSYFLNCIGLIDDVTRLQCLTEAEYAELMSHLNHKKQEMLKAKHEMQTFNVQIYPALQAERKLDLIELPLTFDNSSYENVQALYKKLLSFIKSHENEIKNVEILSLYYEHVLIKRDGRIYSESGSKLPIKVLRTMAKEKEKNDKEEAEMMQLIKRYQILMDEALFFLCIDSVLELPLQKADRLIREKTTSHVTSLHELFEYYDKKLAKAVWQKIDPEGHCEHNIYQLESRFKEFKEQTLNELSSLTQKHKLVSMLLHFRSDKGGLLVLELETIPINDLVKQRDILKDAFARVYEHLKLGRRADSFFIPSFSRWLINLQEFLPLYEQPSSDIRVLELVELDLLADNPKTEMHKIDCVAAIIKKHRTSISKAFAYLNVTKELLPSIIDIKSAELVQSIERKINQGYLLEASLQDIKHMNSSLHDVVIKVEQDIDQLTQRWTQNYICPLTNKKGIPTKQAAKTTTKASHSISVDMSIDRVKHFANHFIPQMLPIMDYIRQSLMSTMRARPLAFDEWTSLRQLLPLLPAPVNLKHLMHLDKIFQNAQEQWIETEKERTSMPLFIKRILYIANHHN